MKTIFVDAINGLILDDGTIFKEMHEMLEAYPNPKIVLTGANDEQYEQFNLASSPYKVFTLKHNPEKTDPEYYRILLDHYKLQPDEVVYFEHNADAVKSANTAGIKTHFYDHTKQDLVGLKQFIDSNL